MLKTLSIKNYALIDSAELDFHSGLNIITGETGAGKTILIDALNLVLGDRASTDVIRKGADKAVIEATFGITANRKVRAFLDENGLEESDDAILRREITAKGQSRCFVNDTPVSLAQLKDVGNHLVDLHGQHEHQSLLRKETHLDLLDDFGGLEGIVDEFRSSYDTLATLFLEHTSLRQKERSLKERRDLYEFQIKEIDAVSPKQGEEESLEAELRILENAEKLFEMTTQLYLTLYEGEGAVFDQLVKARNLLEDLAGIDRLFEEAKSECNSAVVIVDELTKLIQNYNAKIEFNPERLEQIRERTGQLVLLKKKYGGTVDAIIQQREQLGKEFAIAENFENAIRELENRIDEERKKCSAAAQRLSAKRRELTSKISKAVVAELSKLGIPNGRFDIVIENRALDKSRPGSDGVHAFVKLGRDFYEATPRGIDFVEFHLSTNVGEDLKPLVKVASGGEVSRIMLALKSILAKSDRLPSLVFDEIDVGISGRIAQAVGKSLKSLSQFHQIVAITHLPQIASLADTHYVVEKIESHGRTTSRLRKLSDDECIREVARLLSGEEITEAGLEGAKELMGLK
ncbi:MAG TPA: DNA repair protein RecN [Bacteroidota bacterium]|nr:DNA repair protein RecN [Bacteroidota bacterium]